MLLLTTHIHRVHQIWSTKGQTSVDDTRIRYFVVHNDTKISELLQELFRFILACQASTVYLYCTIYDALNVCSLISFPKFENSHSKCLHFKK